VSICIFVVLTLCCL